jgi:hypothetical protein
VPNSNLVEVSDWLTKIIVGLGLTQLGSIPGDFQRLVDYTRTALGSSPSAGSLVGALIVTYAVAGFMLTYLFTRIDLESDIDAADTSPDPDFDRLMALSDLYHQKVLTDEEYESLKGATINKMVRSAPGAVASTPPR